MVIDKIALILAIIGALNWGGIGLFGFDVRVGRKRPNSVGRKRPIVAA